MQEQSIISDKKVLYFKLLVTRSFNGLHGQIMTSIRYTCNKLFYDEMFLLRLDTDTAITFRKALLS